MDKFQRNSKIPNKEIMKINKQNNDHNKIYSINIDDSNDLNASQKFTDLISAEVINGELRKLKTSGLKLFSNTNLRWVELDFKKKIFGYKIKKADPNFKEYQNLYDLLDFKSEISHEEKNKSKWKHGFYLKFKNRYYTFYAENENEFNKWYNTFTRVYNIFIQFKDISLNVFKIALETFATPYYDELERERLQKLEEERKKMKEAPKPKAQKINYAEMLGVKLINNGPKNSDIYTEDLKKNFEEEIDNMEVNKKLQILNNLDNEILEKNNYKKGKVEYNDDIDDWDFYNQANQKIDEKNLINYNPVLKEQRKNLGSLMNSVVKGYIVESHRYIENLNLKTEKKPHSLEKQKIHNNDDNLNNTSNNRVRIILKFSNNDYTNDSSKNLKDYTQKKFEKSNLLTNDKNHTLSNKKVISEYPEEHDFVELKQLQFEQDKSLENKKLKNNKYKGNSLSDFENKNPFNKAKNKPFNNAPEEFLSEEDNFNLKNNFSKKKKKISDLNIKKTFLNEKNITRENKKKEFENNLTNNQAIDGDIKNFKFAKFLITKEQLLKEINNKNNNLQLIKSSSIIDKNDDLYDFDLENFNHIQIDGNNEDQIHNFQEEKKQKKLNTSLVYKNNYINYEKNNSINFLKLQTDYIVKNNKEENGNNPILKNHESPNKTVIQVTKNNLENSNEENNIIIEKKRNVSLLNKYIRQRATEYLNDNININNSNCKNISNNINKDNSINLEELHNEINTNKDRNSKSANKATEWINDVSKNLSINKKQNLIDLIYGKKSKL